MVLFRVEIKLVCMCVCMYANCFYKKYHHTFNSSYFWLSLFPIFNCVLRAAAAFFFKPLATYRVIFVCVYAL